MESNPKKTQQSQTKKTGVSSVAKKKSAKSTDKAKMVAKKVTPVEDKPLDVVERLKNVLNEVRGSMDKAAPKKTSQPLSLEKSLPKKPSATKKQATAKKTSPKNNLETLKKKPSLEKKQEVTKRSANELLEELNAKSKKPLPVSKKSEKTSNQLPITTDVERLKGVISAGKRLQQLMEVKDLKNESKERILKEKISLARRLEEENPEEVTIDELEQEQGKVQELNEKIAVLQAEKAELDSAILKVLAAKVSGIPVIDEESLGLSPSASSGVPVNQQEEVSQTAKKISEIEEVLTSLENQHAENQIKLIAAEQANQQLMEEYGKQAVVVNDLEKEIVTLRGEVLKKQTETVQVKDQLENELKVKKQYQKETEELKKQLELSKAQIPVVKASLKEEMTNKIVALEKQYQEEKKEVLRLQKELQNLTKTMEKNQAKEELAKNSLQEEKKAKLELAKELETLKASLMKIEASAKQRTDEKQVATQMTTEAKQAQAALKREITRLEKAKEAQKAKEQQVKDLLQEEKKTNRRLQKEIDDLKTNLEKEKSKAVPSEKIIAIDQAFQDEKKENDRLQKSLNSLSVAFEELKSQEAGKKAEFDAMKKEHARLTKDNEALRATFEDLKAKSLESKKLYDTEKKLTTKLEKRIETMKTSKKALQVTIRDFKKQEQLQIEKDAQKDQLIEMEKLEKEQVEKQLEQLRLEVDGMVASLQELRQTNETLKSRDLEESTLFEQENQKLKVDNQTITEENNRLFALVDDLRLNNEQLKNQSQALSKRLELDFGSLKQELKDQTQRSETLQEQLSVLELEKEQLQEQLSQYSDSSVESTSNYEQLVQDNNQLKEINQRITASYNDLNLALELLKTKYADLEKTLDKEQMEKSQMQTHIVQTKDEPAKVASLISELNKTQELVKAKEFEIEILKSTLFREQNRITPHEQYPYYGFENMRYSQNAPYQQPQPVEPKIPQVVVEQQEKQSFIEEINALKAEIDKLKQTPAPDSSALLNEFKEELVRNREELSRISLQKDKEIKEISETYESKLQSTEQEKDELREQNNLRLQQINDLQAQVNDKDYTLQNLKNTVKQFTEEDIFDPEFKRRIRLIRDMQKDIANRLDDEAINYNSSVASLELKISQRQQDIDKLNNRIDQLTDTFNANRDFTASTKEVYEKSKAKALLELQLQEERLHELEDDYSKTKSKYQTFVSSKQQELANLKIKEGQIIDYYLRKIRQDYSLTDDFKEIKQVENERNQLLNQINELKSSQEQTVETIEKQSAELTKVVETNMNLTKQLQDERKVAIEKQARSLESSLQEQNRELSDLLRKVNDLKVELDKRLEYEKRLRINEEKVSDFFNNKILLEQCLVDLEERTQQMDIVAAKIEGIGNEPANKTDLLKARAELTDLEVHRDDLHSKINFCKKNIKELEVDPTVSTYIKLINQIDQIRNVQKELREKAEILKEAIQTKNKELDALMKEKSEIV
ncbi:MAG: hypothetical protein AB7V00_01420 [Bacilli bacterium]